jgi:hypothetical protein
MWHGDTFRQQLLHGRHRQVITLLIAAFLIVALIISIREVAANYGQQTDDSSATADVSNAEAIPQGGAMDTTEPNPIDSTSTSSQSVTTHVSSTTDGNGQTSTSVTVNGQPVRLPASGELHKTMSDGNGTTRLDISNDAAGSSSSTSVNVQVNGSSTTTSQ